MRKIENSKQSIKPNKKPIIRLPKESSPYLDFKKKKKVTAPTPTKKAEPRVVKKSSSLKQCKAKQKVSKGTKSASLKCLYVANRETHHANDQDEVKVCTVEENTSACLNFANQTPAILKPRYTFKSRLYYVFHCICTRPKLSKDEATINTNSGKKTSTPHSKNGIRINDDVGVKHLVSAANQVSVYVVDFSCQANDKSFHSVELKNHSLSTSSSQDIGSPRELFSLHDIVIKANELNKSRKKVKNKAFSRKHNDVLAVMDTPQKSKLKASKGIKRQPRRLKSVQIKSLSNDRSYSFHEFFNVDRVTKPMGKICGRGEVYFEC